MKHIIYFAILAGLLLAGFSSCSDSDDEENIPTVTIDTLTVDFEEAAINATAHNTNGTNYSESGLVFENDFNSEYGSFSGFTVSDQTDMVTEGYINQYSVYAQGGAGGSKQFAIYYYSSYASAPLCIKGSGNVAFTPFKMNAALTTYTYLSAKNGDDYSKKFEASDWYKLTIKGLDASGNTIKTIDFNLIENLQFIKAWDEIDLSSMGEVYALTFELTSSDNGDYGCNTPVYAAIDNFKFVLSE